MPVLTSSRVDMTNMIVCDERIQLYVSKPYSTKSTLEPEFGQEVILTSDVTAGETQIDVEPLAENIKAGTVLTFEPSTNQVTVAVPPKEGDTSITIDAAVNAIPNYEIATTDGVEQVLTLGAGVTAGDRIITLASGLDDWVEADKIITFEPSGVQVKAKFRTDAGVSTISIEPAAYDIPAGETADLLNYLDVCSLNQLDDSSNANTINERNFKSGTGTGKAVTSYNDTVTISGNYIKDDFALFRLYNMKEDPTLRGYVINGIIIEPEGGKNYKGKMWLGQHGNQRPNDQTKKISATLEIDGLLKSVKYPV